MKKGLWALTAVSVIAGGNHFPTGFDLPDPI